ncbi:MAG: 3-hydroxyacyl-CoA dehydrogenase family protein, partial [Solirubrobacteraceae bacterium]
MRLVDSPEWPRVVAVVGGGRMGSGIAEAFCAGDLDVRITDADPELSAQARERVVKRARIHVDEGLIQGALIDRAERVQACDSIAEACAGAQLVLEAVAEDLEVKHAVLTEIEGAAGDDAVIATNTSSLPVDRLAEPLRRPERFLGMHWFNPPEWTPGVEVIAAPHTDPAVAERVV